MKRRARKAVSTVFGLNPPNPSIKRGEQMVSQQGWGLRQHDAAFRAAKCRCFTKTNSQILTKPSK
ncbi:MAG: hypothetical protein J7L73_06840, partial [Anaerolineales bacterium]|nr:hypothetical protein [Anaerolineales bacterium]